eukprot:Opistho-2@15159
MPSPASDNATTHAVQSLHYLGSTAPVNVTMAELSVSVGAVAPHSPIATQQQRVLVTARHLADVFCNALGSPLMRRWNRPAVGWQIPGRQVIHSSIFVPGE